jgi:hypothetical protein
MAVDDKYFYFPVVKTYDTVDSKGNIVAGTKKLYFDTQYIDIRDKTNPDT